MADSLWKDVVDLLNAGAWTSKPTIVQVTEYTSRSIGQIAEDNKSNDGFLVVFPNVSDSEYVLGFASEKHEFPCTIFKFGTRSTADSLQDELSTYKSDIKDILKKGSISGHDDVYLEDWTNWTNRKTAANDPAKFYIYAEFKIIVEDWPS